MQTNVIIISKASEVSQESQAKTDAQILPSLFQRELIPMLQLSKIVDSDNERLTICKNDPYNCSTIYT